MPVTFMVYGAFVVPDTPARACYIIITVPDRSALTMPWKTQILPAVARLLRPWCHRLQRRRVKRRVFTATGVKEFVENVEVLKSLREVRSEIWLDGGAVAGGSDLLTIRSTKRYVWRDKKLEEDTSP